MKHTKIPASKATRSSLVMLLLSSLFILSCNKDKDIFLPPPGQADTTSFIQVKAAGISSSTVPLFAIITLAKDGGDTVMKKQKVALTQTQDGFQTDKIRVSKGNYLLTHFIVVGQNDSAVYVAPIANSIKAGMVRKPLALQVAVPATGILNTDVEVIAVRHFDIASDYGYRQVDFGFQPLLSISFTMRIKVGEYWYDSLPAKIQLKALRTTGGPWTSELTLEQGFETINVPSDISELQVTARQWNFVITKNYTRERLTDQMVVKFETQTQPKRLVREMTVRETINGTTDEQKVEYFYLPDGKVAEAKYYQRFPQLPGLPLFTVQKLVYGNGKVNTINNFDLNLVKTGYSTFSYQDNEIKSIEILNYGLETSVTAQHLVNGTDKTINAQYQFDNGTSKQYTINLKDGNIIYSQARSSSGALETTRYLYDKNINPYLHLGIPDMYFTHLSKNNAVVKNKNHVGVPLFVPYKIEYTYDGDGYPATMVTSYKNLVSGLHSFLTRKTFFYEF